MSARKKKYKIAVEVVEVNGICPPWKKGDTFEFSDFVKIKDVDPKIGRTLKTASIASGILCTYSISQLHPILAAMCRGNVGANELGLGDTADVAYVTCEAPALGDAPKAHGRVVFKLTRIPLSALELELVSFETGEWAPV